VITVYTCIFGNTDPIHDPQCPKNVRYVCFTDQNVKSDYWEIVKVPKQQFPTRAARTMKILSHKHIETEYSFWIDANFILLECPLKLTKYGDFVRFIHRDRTNIKDEAAEIARLGKAKPEMLKKQLSFYHSEGFTNQRVLSCNSVILRKHSKEVIELNELWYQQIQTFTLWDQMSLDYCAWKLGFELSAWPGTHGNNPYFVHKHYKRPTNDY
jgi:hypothetical protein